MRRIAPLVVFAFACQRPPNTDTGLSGGGGSFAPMGSTGDATSSGSSDATSSGSSAATSSGSSATTSISSTGDGQTSSQGTDTVAPGSACNGKIDLIFVITQDGYFISFIDALYDSYPAILATIQDEFADLDLHVMFASPNDSWAAQKACPKGMCPEEGGCPGKGYEEHRTHRFSFSVTGGRSVESISATWSNGPS